MKYIDFILKPILRILFPPQCLTCGKALVAGVICKPCLASIPLYTTLFCARCGARIPVVHSGNSSFGSRDIRAPISKMGYPKRICHRDAAYLLGSAGPYDDPTLRCLIHDLKFRGARGAAGPLAEIIARYLENLAFDLNDFLLIPVPLSQRRRNERGFNQTEEVARHLAQLMPLQIKTDVLIRTRNTKPQTETADAAERRRNVLTCFSIVKPDVIAGKNILLLDDVATSGATLGEAAHALKDAGARRIIGVTAAKA